jgi:hypothetical protein
MHTEKISDKVQSPNEEHTIKTNANEHAGNFSSEEMLVCHLDEFWYSEVKHFFGAIHEKRKPHLGCSNDALVVMNLMDRIYER